jgi:hypothetical protein
MRDPACRMPHPQHGIQDWQRPIPRPLAGISDAGVPMLAPKDGLDGLRADLVQNLRIGAQHSTPPQ